MKNKHMKLIIILFVFAVILGVIYSVFAPKKILSDEDNVGIVRVTYLGEELEVNENDLLNILKKYRIMRSLKDYFPYDTEDVDIDIFLSNNDKPESIHILLGNINILYNTKNRFAYRIMDSENLKEELIKVFNK